MILAFPTEPVDLYEVRIWTADQGQIRERRYVYHKNTPWAAFAPGKRVGADIVDQWMVYNGDHCDGRIEGWSSLPDLLVATSCWFSERMRAVECARGQIRVMIKAQGGVNRALDRALDELNRQEPLSTEEPVHEWFELSYGNYLVLQRSILQSMPTAWQRRFVACLQELEAATERLPDKPSGYWVRGHDRAGQFVRDPYRDYERGRRRIRLGAEPKPPQPQG